MRSGGRGFQGLGLIAKSFPHRGSTSCSHICTSAIPNAMDSGGVLSGPVLLPVPSWPLHQVTPCLPPKACFASAFWELPLWATLGDFCAPSFHLTQHSCLFRLGLPLEAGGGGASASTGGIQDLPPLGPCPSSVPWSLCSPCRTQGGVHVHKDGLTVTSPVLMWVQVSTGVPVPFPSTACLTCTPGSEEHLLRPSPHGEVDSV